MLRKSCVKSPPVPCSGRKWCLMYSTHTYVHRPFLSPAALLHFWAPRRTKSQESIGRPTLSHTTPVEERRGRNLAHGSSCVCACACLPPSLASSSSIFPFGRHSLTVHGKKQSQFRQHRDATVVTLLLRHSKPGVRVSVTATRVHYRRRTDLRTDRGRGCMGGRGSG